MAAAAPLAFCTFQATAQTTTTQKGDAIGADQPMVPPTAAQTVTSQSATEGALQDIVVTAQKREQNLTEVPAAITAVTGDKLETLGVQNLPEVARLVPNFNVNYDRGQNSTPNFALRGVRGDGLPSRFNESSIAIYADEVFLSDETLINTLLFDVGRVEVLRGPQGTVFGKNTTGGLVHFISAKPTNEFSGYFNLQYGSANETIIEAALSGPVSDRIRVRVSGKWDRDDGRFKNDYLGAGQNGIPTRIGDTNNWGERGIVDIDLTDRTMLRLIGNYGENNSQPQPGRAFGALPVGSTKTSGFTRADICSNADILAGRCVSLTQIVLGGAPVVGRLPGHGITNLTDDEDYIHGVIRSGTAILTHDLGWATATSITDYRSGHFYLSIDGDGGLTPSVNTGYDILASFLNRSHQFSQELRLNGNTSAFSWVTGLYYENDHKESTQITDYRTLGKFLPFNLSFLQQADGAVNTRSYALFGQLDAHLSSKFTLSMGGRYSLEQRELVQADTFQTNLSPVPSSPPVQNILAALPQPKINNKNFTGKISLSFEPNAASNYYMTYSRGIKGAGFSSGYNPSNSLAVNVALTGPVGQEVLDAFELGAKKRFGNKLSINSAAFFYDFNGKQETLNLFNGLVAIQSYLNVGEAQIYGIETEINYRPSRRWDLSVSAGALHSEVVKSSIFVTDQFGVPRSLQGSRLAQTPDWDFNAIGAYHVPTRVGQFTLQGEIRGQGNQSYSITNDPLANEESHIFTNFRLLWNSANGRYNASALVTNAFNEREAVRMTAVASALGAVSSAEGEGRIWGIRTGIVF